MKPNNLLRRAFLPTLIWSLFLVPLAARASLIINEIAYDLEGSDTDREWVEIFNDQNVAVDLTGWKFYEADTNHGLKVRRGSGTIEPGGFAVIADNADTFLTEHVNFTGNLFDSSFSLSNTGEIIALKNEAGDVIDTISYSKDSGAAGDGNTLQKNPGGWIAATPSPGMVNKTAAEPPPGGGGGTESGGSDTQSGAGSLSSGGGSGASAPPAVKPSISAEAGEDRTVVAGASTVFEGLAYGLEGKPIPNARFIWNFGDGGTAEGQSVLHTYSVPGGYLAVLEASSGEYNASDRIRVSVISSPITIRRVAAGFDGLIELSNSAATEINLSFWELVVGRASFRLPKNTFITGGGMLPLPNSVTGLTVTPNDNVLLRYQNGTVAATFASGETVTPISTFAVAPLPKGNGVVPRVVINNEESTKTFSRKSMASAEAEVGGSQLAAVLPVSEETRDDPQGVPLTTWLSAVGGVAVLGIISVLALRRRQGSATGFTIIEEKTEDQTNP